MINIETFTFLVVIIGGLSIAFFFLALASKWQSEVKKNKL